MSDAPLRDLLHDGGTTGERPIETATDAPAGAAPVTAEASPALVVLGSQDAAVCTDGVCVL